MVSDEVPYIIYHDAGISEVKVTVVPVELVTAVEIDAIVGSLVIIKDIPVLFPAKSTPEIRNTFIPQVSITLVDRYPVPLTKTPFT